MAKVSKNMVFKNAEIDLENMLLIEVGKDECEEFPLMDVLKEWDRISGLTITFKQEQGFSSASCLDDEDGE